MAIGKISGTMLQANLERQGTNISIDATAYFDVNNHRFGVNTLSPQYTLDISGNAHLGNLYILGNTISSDSGAIISSAVNFSNTTNAISPSTGTISVSGGVGIAQDLWVGGNFYANAIISENISVLSIADSLLYLVANAPYPYTYDIGFYSHFYGGSGNVYQHTGLVRNHLDNTWYLFSNTPEPTGSTVNFSNAWVVLDTLNAGAAILANSTASTSNSTGALVVTGGAGIGGNVYIAGSNGNAVVTNANVWAGNIYTGSITPYQSSVITFNSSTAIGLPAGSSTQYPSSNVAGYLRYNNSISTLEFYNGSSWVALTNSISDQTITPDGVNQSFGLNQSTTANGILVSINGTVQRPGVAYTVTGTTITFTEVPQNTDIIDVRYIATAVSTSLDFEIVDTGNVTVGTSNVIIDSFASSQYRSVKYTISSTTAWDAQFAEVILVQNAGTVVVNTIGNTRTGGNSVTYYANVNGSTVNLLAISTVATTQLRIQRTYFNV